MTRVIKKDVFLIPFIPFSSNAGSRTRPVLLFACLVLVWLAAIPMACLFGPYPLPFADTLAMLCRFLGFAPGAYGNETAMLVVGEIRLARTCAALVCGGLLGVAGVTLQGGLRNPLADPFTLGISAGAACGASLAIAWQPYFVWIGLGQGALISTSALAGALMALAAALLLGRGGGRFGRETVILAGIAVAAFMGALVALVKALNEESVTSIVFWLMGSLQGITFDSLPILVALAIPGLLVCALLWRRLDALLLGDEEAASLGMNPGASRLWLLAAASCMTAGCVATCGIIGFVGLVVPHMLRMLFGPCHGPLLAGVFFAGGLFLLLADCLARSVLDGGQELPVGVVTALVGGPFFAFLVWKRK